MSKKTNTAKQKGRTAKPRRRVHVRKGKRPNPRGSKAVQSLMEDPIFWMHASGMILRYIHLAHPVAMELEGSLNSGAVDAEFVPPKEWPPKEWFPEMKKERP